MECRCHFTRAFEPSDERSRQYLEGLGRALALIDDNTRPTTVDKTILVLADFAQMARDSQDGLVCWSQDKNDYAGEPYGYDIQRKVFDNMLEYPLLQKKAEGNGKDKAAVYGLLYRTPSFLRLRQHGIGKALVQVKTPRKHPVFDRATQNIKLSEFGEEAEYRLKEMEDLVEFYKRHPLTDENGTEYHLAYRVFNNGSLREGGRIYGHWQTVKVKDRNRRLDFTIDGEELVEIDIKACFLYLAYATSGSNHPLPKDPYAVLAKKEEYGRDAVKSFVNTFFSKGGEVNSFTKGFRAKFKVNDKDRVEYWLDDLFSAYPFLRHYKSSAGELMFKESELILEVIKSLKEKEVVAYSVHDSLLAKRSDESIVISELQKVMINKLGKEAYLEVEYKQ